MIMQESTEQKDEVVWLEGALMVRLKRGREGGREGGQISSHRSKKADLSSTG